MDPPDEDQNEHAPIQHNDEEDEVEVWITYFTSPLDVALGLNSDHFSGFVSVPSHTTLSELKDLIEMHHRLRIPARDQILRCTGGNLLLNIYQTVSEMPRNDDGDLELDMFRKIPRSMVQFRIRIDDLQQSRGLPLHMNTITLILPSTTYFSQVKREIDASLGLSPHRQLLMHEDINEPNGDFNRIDDLITQPTAPEPLELSLSEIRRNSVLVFDARVELPNGVFVYIEVEPSDTIFDLKGELRRAGHVNTDNFIIVIRGLPADGAPPTGHATLAELYVDHDSTLLVVTSYRTGSCLMF